MIHNKPQTPTTPERLWPHLRSWWWSGLGALVFAATVAIGLAIKASGPKPAELGVDIALAQDRNPVLSALSLAIHYGLGPLGAVIILVLACLILVRRSVNGALAFGSVVGVGWLASAIAKYLVARMRPPSDTVHALVHEQGLTSYPSGHTAFALALACAFVLVVPRSRRAKAVSMAAGAVFVALVAFSRLYLGVHYPSDVLASVFIAGAAIVAWLPVWNHLIAPRFTKQARLSPSSRAQGRTGRVEQTGEAALHSDGRDDGPTSRDCQIQERTPPIGESKENP
ncbi:phosphatase PAP2 family protein [Arthrobacter sp. A2-55]|uniref:phosphatase PAP2 family protein n=1 Tax=Arthrobacter sp. A2-55 TaxID=2897337 RepID=UPI0021CD883B|nr:phosphatase PAP2 family protein [Arthrobacter sp. A2-55]MCU6481810.1 phosphatase PAP2 family protein [Arthrobacter sp. A2-55]